MPGFNHRGLNQNLDLGGGFHSVWLCPAEPLSLSVVFYGGSLRLFVDSELDQNRACDLNVTELVFFPILFVL